VNTVETLSPETEQLLRQQKENWRDVTSPASGTLREEEQLKTRLKPRQDFLSETSHLEENEIPYACLLIPRFSEHYLSGDITQNLPVWLREICISYGWRLESIVIRPGYMHWVVSVQPSTSPANMIRIIRHHSSRKILSEFPRYEKQNLAGDFWAPGFAVTAGCQFLPPEEISNFIKLTRQQQGTY